MILLALVPPLWRRVMDPRVRAHFGGDLTRANLQPSKREQILGRYPRQPAGDSVRSPAQAVWKTPSRSARR